MLALILASVLAINAVEMCPAPKPMYGGPQKCEEVACHALGGFKATQFETMRDAMYAMTLLAPEQQDTAIITRMPKTGDIVLLWQDYKRPDDGTVRLQEIVVYTYPYDDPDGFTKAVNTWGLEGASVDSLLTTTSVYEHAYLAAFRVMDCPPPDRRRVTRH